MSYELYEQGPEAYIPILIANLVVTILAYGAFPFIFAKIRNASITEKRYRRLCYGINAAVMFVFMILKGGAFNAAPYLLWTWVFSRYGIKELNRKGVIENSGQHQEPNCSSNSKSNSSYTSTSDVSFRCSSCGYQDTVEYNTCPKCGAYVYKRNKPVEEPKIKQLILGTYNNEHSVQKDKVYFCRHCGAKLMDNSKFCHKCGMQIEME